jgi:hypothetical protein
MRKSILARAVADLVSRYATTRAVCKSNSSQTGLSLFLRSRNGIFANGHISAPAIPWPTAFVYFMSAPVDASCPSPLSLRLAPSYSAQLCSCIMRWTRGHSIRLGWPEFLSLRHSASAASVAHSRSTLSARQPHAAFLHFISSLPVLRRSFLTSAGLSSSAHATEMQKSPSCHAKSPNQAMQRTASQATFRFMSVCHLPFGCELRFNGLAVADLVSRYA